VELPVILLLVFWSWKLAKFAGWQTAKFCRDFRRGFDRIRYGPSEPGWWHEPEAESEDQATAIRAGRIAIVLAVLRSQRR